MKRVFLILLLFACSFLSNRVDAQSNKSWPKTLLWRISGNGLSGNSFLYGTIHLQDKRLFYFSDSLYKYLEQADGYALEIDLQEYMDSAIQKIIDQKENDIIDKKRLSHLPEKRKIVDSLIKNIKNNNDKASKQQLEKIRDETMRKAIKNKEMPTIMDAYLYGIARRHGKWLGGIEDVQDQLSLFDEFGTEISADELFTSDKELTASLEKMVSVYLAKDLNEIEKFSTNQYSDELENALFHKRNIKMARRMDSLSHVRNMFFTVGAAHLPGDSGVINLLRGKGYRVDPVFSATKVDPLTYSSRLTQLPWMKVEDERKNYQVEMPGKPSDLSMFGEIIKMKFYIDITTLTYFMAGSTPVMKEVDFEKAIEQLSDNTDAKILSKKLIQRDGMKGIESVMMSSDNYYKAQYLLKDNMLYILLAGGDKKEVVETPDVNKFFSSFVIQKKKPVEKSNQWSVFELKDKGFSVEVPGEFNRNEKIEKKAAGTQWMFTVYDRVDASSGIYYTVQVRDINPGYYIENDSSYFALFRENLKEAIQTVTKDSLFTIGSFPAFSYEGKSMEDELLFKTLTITRGNRVYNFFGVGSMTSSNKGDIDRFLNSVTLTEYQKASWNRQTVKEGNFYTVAPSAIKLKEKENKDEEEVVATEKPDPNYISYNDKDCISYHVLKTGMSPYYWIKNDTAFFKSMGLAYKAWNDSIISEKWVSNGKLKGKEWVIFSPGSTNLKKLRHLLNGDTLYTLLTLIPAQYIDKKENQLFFEQFRVINEEPVSAVYKSKAVKLLTDLRSPDTATFEKASGELSGAVFEAGDRSLLQEALLKDYPRDEQLSYKLVKNKIIEVLSQLADSATVVFIRQQFPQQPDDIKFDMLDVLARYRTTYSYGVLKELLLTHTPQGTNRQLSYWVTDSIQLTRNLYPEILSLTTNRLFGVRILGISDQLLDSNLITKNMLVPYEKNFLYIADTICSNLKKKTADDDDYDYEYTDVLPLLEDFNDEPCNRMLQKYLNAPQTAVKYQALLSLLKNKQPVDVKQVEKIAADKSHRRDLYDTLVNSGNQRLFPARYLTQRYMAESDMYAGAYNDDEEPEEIVFLKTKEIVYKGERSRFYLYKIKYPSEEDTGETQYLGVAGPYPMELKKLNAINERTGLWYEKTFDPKLIDKQFEDFLKQFEKDGGN